ncbi:MAG TPA: DedA family protein [Candidatus Limnocylindria bacterium]|nr:DedA family protein [Candidatus Limnocylindria bacterium]
MLEFINQTVIPFFLDLYDALGYVGVAIGVALETFIPLIPSELILPMAGWKVSQSAADPSVTEWLTGEPWTIVGVMVAATLGATVGSLGIYLIGAWGGRPLLERYGRYVRVEADDLDRADAWFARHGDKAVFFGRFVPLLRSFVSFPAGVARMRLGRFLLFTALGSIPWNLAMVIAGWVLGENYDAVAEALSPYELPIYILVGGGLLFVIVRWIRGRGSPEKV